MPKYRTAATYVRGAEIRKGRLIMYRVVDETTGEIISLENARFETMCPDCEEWYPIDLLTYAAD